MRLSALGRTLRAGAWRAAASETTAWGAAEGVGLALLDSVGNHSSMTSSSVKYRRLRFGGLE